MEKVSRYLWSTSFAPDYSATVLAAKLCTYSNYYIYIRFSIVYTLTLGCVTNKVHNLA
jgi:hypothetical protein